MRGSFAMLAALAFEPLVCAGFRVERPEQTSAAVREPDPEMAALIREIRRVEGETVIHPPQLFRLVEVCGFAIIGACATGLASGLVV